VPLRILIIDDHRDFRAWLGHHVAAARPDATILGHDPTAESALPDGFQPAEWDLVFLDHRPGAHDGLALLCDLKGNRDCPPVVVLTPQGDQQAIVRALQAGADDFLAKGPNSHEHIGRVVREAVRRGGRSPPDNTAASDGVDTPGFRLKGHRLLKQLGCGATASVYLMEKERSKRLVVAKVFRQAPDGSGQLAPLQRFLREYEVISAVRHPNVVRIFDLGIADDMAFIVMEYFAGGHLGECLSEGMSKELALQNLAQVARALDVIHRVGVLHRDLKPANIMLRGDGTLALIDFGVAKLRDTAADLTRLGEIFGTPYYMSPEQGEGAPVDERADIYSLGIVFHEMLTGRKPYVAGSPMSIIWKHRHAPLPVLPAPLESCQPLLDRLLAKSVDDRFSSARDVLDAIGLQQAQSAGSERAAPGPVAGRS
jgi:eukaryotic-like serine/threonine-protein kinase